MNRRILLNVAEMDSNRLSDIDFFQGCTQLFRELAGILVRPVSRTKARHQNTDRIFSRGIPSRSKARTVTKSAELNPDRLKYQRQHGDIRYV